MTALARVKHLLHELQIHPNKKLGQNFLVSDSVIGRICEQVSRLKSPLTIEVGPGLGALTDVLRTHTEPLVLIELDRRLAQYWRDQGCQVIEEDALALDWGSLEIPPGGCLVSNLPYQISSSLVIERSLGPTNLTHMILMFQREVAQRIQGTPSTRDYGLLSVMAQSFWEIERVVDAPPGAFFPSPEVTSRVLAFHRRPTERIIDKVGYLAFVKAAFALRRKQVGKQLIAFASREWGLSREVMLQKMELLGIRPTQRAEEISIDQWQELFLAASKKK